MNDKYLPRIVDTQIADLLEISGGILIVGPRGSGKTETGMHFSRSFIQLSNPIDLDKSKLNVREVLNGLSPRLIDEWQLVPSIFNYTKIEIDNRKEFGLFILSGSSAPDDNIAMHSGAGRIIKVNLRPMSLQESNNSSEEVNFKNLFKINHIISGKKSFSLEFYVDKILRGGWPRYVNLPGEKVKRVIKGYIDSLVAVDMRNIKSPPDPIRMQELIKAVARNIGTQASIKKLAIEADIHIDDNGNSKTTRKYLDQLSQVYVLEELQAWKSHARSSVRLLEKSKWYFVDPSIESAVLNLSYEKLISDRNYFGFVFESLVIRDLRVYADSIGGHVYFFKDSNGYEVDAIVELNDGSWSAFEVKLGSLEGISEGVEVLKRLKGKVAERNINNLKSLNIITIGTGSYTRNDGINIIEFGNLYIKQ